MSNKMIKFGVIFFIILILFFILKPFTVIDAGHTGVVKNMGAVSDTVFKEGFNWKTPLVQSVVEIDNRVQKLEVQASSASKDLQTVTSAIAVNFYVDPAIQESIKAVTAKYTAEQLITERTKVSGDIKVFLSDKLSAYGVVVKEINIVNFDFSEEFNRAIESKQTAQQLALKAQQDLERVKIEAEQKIAQAEAEAQALKAQKQEITPDLLKLREIEAQIKAIEKWNGQLPNYVGGDTESMFSIPLN